MNPYLLFVGPIILAAVLVVKCRATRGIPMAVCLASAAAAANYVVAWPEHPPGDSSEIVWEDLASSPLSSAPSPGAEAPSELSLMALPAPQAVVDAAINVGEFVQDVAEPVVAIALSASAPLDHGRRQKPVLTDWDELITRRLLDHGGKEGIVTFTLVWFDRCDLDLWVTLESGERIGFLNRRARGGELDVDSNAGLRIVNDPIENITFVLVAPRGTYRVAVDHYTIRPATPTSLETTPTSRFLLRVVIDGRRELHYGEVAHRDGGAPEQPEFNFPATWTY